MAEKPGSEPTCSRCGSPVTTGVQHCTVCGSDPSAGPLVIRRDQVPALPWRRVAGPLTAGAAVMTAGLVWQVAQRLLPALRSRRHRTRAMAEPKESPARGPIVAIRRRVWAVGDSHGPQRWGAEETVWHAPSEGA